MRRLLSIAVFGAAALLIPSAQAQMRGGFGGRGGGISAPRVSSGFRSGPAFRSGPVMGGRTFAPRGPVFAGRPGFARPGFARPGFAPRGFAGSRVVVPPGRTVRSFSFGRLQGDIFFSNNCPFFPCHNGFFHHNHFFFGSPFFGAGFGFGSPFFGAGFGNPFFGAPFWGASYIPGFDYPYDYYQPPQQQPVAAEPATNASDVQLAMQIQRLSDEISDLRGEQALQRMQNRPAPPPGTSMSVVPPAAATTFVFKNGNRVTAQNYAITGQTLWVLSEHAAKKFALTDLDRAATEQVNAQSGVELHLPEPAKR